MRKEQETEGGRQEDKLGPAAGEVSPPSLGQSGSGHRNLHVLLRKPAAFGDERESLLPPQALGWLCLSSSAVKDSPPLPWGGPCLSSPERLSSPARVARSDLAGLFPAHPPKGVVGPGGPKDAPGRCCPAQG